MFNFFQEKEVIKILLPSGAAVILFTVTTFLLILPSFETSLIAERKAKLRHVSQVAVDILHYYHDLECSGLMDRRQAQQAASRQIEKIRYGDGGKDYFWINDMHPRMVMHPYRPELNGSDLSRFKDYRGQNPFTEFVDIASEAGGGFVDYFWQWKDDPDRIAPKLSFVAPFAPWDWIVGTGIYMNDVSAEIDALTGKLVTSASGILVLVGLLNFYIVGQGLQTAKRRRAHEEELNRYHKHLKDMVADKTRELRVANSRLSEEVRVKEEIALRLKEQHEYLQEIIEAIPYPFCVFESDDITLLTANRAVDEYNIENPESFFTAAAGDRQGLDGLAVFSSPFQQVKEEKTSLILEYTDYSSADTPVFWEFYFHPVLSGAGEVKDIIASAIDITRRRAMEEDLRISEERYRKLIETAIDAVMVSDLETGEILQINRSAEKMLGVPKSGILGSRQTDFIYPHENYKKFEEKFHRYYKKGSGIISGLHLIHRKSRHIPVEIGISVVDWTGRRVVQCIFRDITQRKIMENKLCRAQKLEAVGTLAGGIAHDFNNLLTVILGYADLLMVDLPPVNQAKDNLQKIIKAGQRARDLVSQILTFSKYPFSCEEKTNVLLQSAVVDALKLLGSTIPKTIEIRQDLDESCPPILSNFSQVQQIIFNLCTNAYHAMREKGGVLEIRVLQRYLEEKEAGMIDVDPGAYAVLTVKDNGPGMEEGIVSRIFDPYFTTKNVDEGTGLGLATVQGIVRSHRGGIQVTSRPGEGSSFEVFFPLGNPAPDMINFLEEGEVFCELPRINKNILFVDDEVMIASMGELYFEKLGCRVTPCSSGTEALQEFRRNPDLYDIVITDQVMPAMSGSDLAAEIRKIRDDIFIIVTTGYSDIINEQNAQEMGIDKFIMKPLDLHKILDAINDTPPDGLP